jgi:hypothetical protein
MEKLRRRSRSFSASCISLVYFLERVAFLTHVTFFLARIVYFVSCFTRIKVSPFYTFADIVIIGSTEDLIFNTGETIFFSFG